MSYTKDLYSHQNLPAMPPPPSPRYVYATHSWASSLHWFEDCLLLHLPSSCPWSQLSAILHHQDPNWSPDNAPDNLPEVIQAYVELQIQMPGSFVTGLWHNLWMIVWHETNIIGEVKDLKEFQVHQDCGGLDGHMHKDGQLCSMLAVVYKRGFSCAINIGFSDLWAAAQGKPKYQQ